MKDALYIFIYIVSNHKAACKNNQALKSYLLLEEATEHNR